MDEPVLSIVAPCYNEEESLPEFHRRVTEVCEQVGLPYELVLVNDGSRDADVKRHLLELDRAPPPAWLERIGALRKEGRTGEADALLAEFRRRYPEVSVPPEPTRRSGWA